MGKLHEVLAVEPELKSEAQRTYHSVRNLCAEGANRFIGEVRSYKPLEEAGEPFPDEVVEMATTVGDELARLQSAYGAWIDIAVQKEMTNQIANADVVVNGKVLLAGLSATALLNLEGKLAEVRALYAEIPTNDPAERWELDEQTGSYIAPDRVSYRTKKVPRRFVKQEPTKEHPAQVDVFTEDVRVGVWTKKIRSGMLTPREKRQRLARLDVLIRAVKKARQRANNAEVEDVRVAEVLFRFIDEGVA